ncbi:MAG: four helix bundle protein [Coraliomargarita sp.]
MAASFDHEKLQVYQRALDVIVLVEAILEKLPKRVAAYDQLDRASTSIPLNIAEGNGKFTPADRCRFFDIARGSALECAAALDVLSRKRLIAETKAEEGKQLLREIVSMLVGLIRSNSTDRVYEEQDAYNTGD